jgi:peptide/nickel transport system substrate-binding protein
MRSTLIRFVGRCPCPARSERVPRYRRSHVRTGAAAVAVLTTGAMVLAACGGSSAPSALPSTTAGNAAAAPSSTASAVRGGTLHVAVVSDPPTLDWTYSTSTITYEVAWNILEQLFALDKNSTPKPMLATGYQVGPHGLHYVIGLRSGVKFQNGQAMTSADVVASIERWEKVSSVGKTVATHVASVSAAGPETVDITMSSPYSPLIADLATPSQACIIIPASIAQAAGTNPLSDNQIVGTGPYTLTKSVRGQVIELSRWSGYQPLPKADVWGGDAGYKAAYFDHLDYEIVPSASTRLSGLLTGQFQLADTLTAQDYPEFSGNNSVRPIIVPSANQLMVVFNKMTGPFVSTKMREAINLVIDKKAMLAGAFGPSKFWSLNDGMFFPNQGSLYTSVGNKEYSAYNPTEAKSLMKAAGYNFNRPLRILVTKTYPYMYNAGVVLAQELQQIGVKTQVVVYDWPTDLAERKNPNAWDIFITGFAPLYDPTQLLWILPTYNGWYDSPQMQQLLSEWSATMSASAKASVLDRIQRLEWTQLPIVKIGNQRDLSGSTSKLQGYGAFAGNDVLWNAWLAK